MRSRPETENLGKRTRIEDQPSDQLRESQIILRGKEKKLLGGYTTSLIDGTGGPNRGDKPRKKRGYESGAGHSKKKKENSTASDQRRRFLIGLGDWGRVEGIGARKRKRGSNCGKNEELRREDSLCTSPSSHTQ